MKASRWENSRKEENNQRRQHMGGEQERGGEQKPRAMPGSRARVSRHLLVRAPQKDPQWKHPPSAHTSTLIRHGIPEAEVPCSTGLGRGVLPLGLEADMVSDACCV